MDGPTATSGLMCVKNVEEEVCGKKEGAACCGFTRPAGITEMSCSEDRGLRCPTELLITRAGVMHSQLRCVGFDADDDAVAASLALSGDDEGDALLDRDREEEDQPTPLDEEGDALTTSTSGPSTAVIAGVASGIAVAALLCIVGVVIMKKHHNSSSSSQSQDLKGSSSPRGSPKRKDTRLDENVIFVVADTNESDKDLAFDDGDENA